MKTRPGDRKRGEKIDEGAYGEPQKTREREQKTNWVAGLRRRQGQKPFGSTIETEPKGDGEKRRLGEKGGEDSTRAMLMVNNSTPRTSNAQKKILANQQMNGTAEAYPGKKRRQARKH